MGFASFSLVGLKLKHSRWILRSNGLEPRLVELDDGSTVVHCWAPSSFREEEEGKAALVLLHGFGGDGTMAWDGLVGALAKRFWVFVPDLLFFGASSSRRQERSEVFQAECVVRALGALGVTRCFVAGHSYGGFVAYRMAHLHPAFVRRLVLVSSGVAMGPATNEPLLRKARASSIDQILVPSDLAAFKTGLSLVLNYLPSWLPDFVYMHLFKSMAGDRHKRLELVEGIILGKANAPPLPRITQEVLIIWGDQDQIFDIDLAYQLKEFLGATAKLEVLKGVGHMPTLFKPKLVSQLLIRFLTPS